MDNTTPRELGVQSKTSTSVHPGQSMQRAIMAAKQEPENKVFDVELSQLQPKLDVSHAKSKLQLRNGKRRPPRRRLMSTPNLSLTPRATTAARDEKLSFQRCRSTPDPGILKRAGEDHLRFVRPQGKELTDNLGTEETWRTLRERSQYRHKNNKMKNVKMQARRRSQQKLKSLTHKENVPLPTACVLPEDFDTQSEAPVFESRPGSPLKAVNNYCWADETMEPHRAKQLAEAFHRYDNNNCLKDGDFDGKSACPLTITPKYTIRTVEESFASSEELQFMPGHTSRLKSTWTEESVSSEGIHSLSPASAPVPTTESMQYRVHKHKVQKEVTEEDLQALQTFSEMRAFFQQRSNQSDTKDSSVIKVGGSRNRRSNIKSVFLDQSHMLEFRAD